MDETKIKKTFAQKLAFYRKSASLTQAQLAEDLNYSDKAVSKWERGEALPDVFTLLMIAEKFGCTVDDLINEQKPAKPLNFIHDRLLITLMSLGLVWFAAALGFSVMTLLSVTGAWLCFIYAIPVSGIVAIVFTSLWWNKIWQAVSVSVLMWSLVLCFVVTFKIVKIMVFFAAAAVFQILIILFFMIKKSRKNKQK